ncbi:sensor histidine kinase [Nocardioides bizhenqiangii]|uniref:histidine kinase n=1 Tax=Nocardioides bizhenqiangii TaxID=3095076 RepID=A0ABZ0ZR13_9ACTN|nr:sensor histidine kinase [Nocardioides sp. HM61]WQQ26191.1 sensor histidine kinase [Nocardioides sp. HM61]
MADRAARVIAPTMLALFAVVGAVMGHRSLPVGLVLAASVTAIAAATAWRGLVEWRLAVPLLVAAAGLVAIGHGNSANLVWMGFCVAAGWVALVSTLPATLTVGGVLGLTLVSEWAQQTEEPGWAAWITGTAFTLVACIFARRLRETVRQLEAAQHQLAERSRAEERTRIAGEMHDVIGHALTVSLLHISGARLALDEDPDEARRALAEAERLSRSSLEEVRATVGLMRTDAPGERAPLPVATDIGRLVDSFRSAGTEVDLTVTGDLEELGPTRGLAAYRIVQEALTNAVKHAPGERVTVAVTVESGTATVAVRNGGDVDASAPLGNGLLGMRDRAEGVGGRLRAGAEQRGWLVEAVLPS